MAKVCDKIAEIEKSKVEIQEIFGCLKYPFGRTGQLPVFP
jgi:hypothetical protein